MQKIKVTLIIETPSGWQSDQHCIQTELELDTTNGFAVRGLLPWLCRRPPAREFESGGVSILNAVINWLQWVCNGADYTPIHNKDEYVRQVEEMLDVL